MVGRIHSAARASGDAAGTAGCALRRGSRICIVHRSCGPCVRSGLRRPCVALESAASQCRWTARWRRHAGPRRGSPGGSSTDRPAGTDFAFTAARDGQPRSKSIARRGSSNCRGCRLSIAGPGAAARRGTAGRRRAGRPARGRGGSGRGGSDICGSGRGSNRDGSDICGSDRCAESVVRPDACPCSSCPGSPWSGYDGGSASGARSRPDAGHRFTSACPCQRQDHTTTRG